MIEPELFQSHTHGRTHVAGVHAVPSPRYTPCAAVHCACVKIAQNAAALVAAGRQHAPRPAGGGHWAASQVTPLCHVPCRFAHTAAVVTMQRELVVEMIGLQHAPRGTQMSLLHTVPLPR